MEFSCKVRKALRKGRKVFFVFVFLAKTQRRKVLFCVLVLATDLTDGTDFHGFFNSGFVEFSCKVRKALRKGRKVFFVFVFLAKAQNFVLCVFEPRIWRMELIFTDFLIVVLWSLAAKCAKGYARNAKVFLCLFSRKDAKTQSFVLCVGFGHGFGGWNGLKRIF